MKFNALQQKRQMISKKNIIGIDPAKAKHQAAVINEHGMQLAKPFMFKNNYEGFHIELWHKIQKIDKSLTPKNTIFAIENACNLWQKLAMHLYHKGYKVVIVSPLNTYHSRPMINHDFSRTDPKDALLVASNAKDGYFDNFKLYKPSIRTMHLLSICYDKIRKQLVQNKQRLRATVELIFPEFLNALDLDTDSARYLLRNYFLPQHFLSMNIKDEIENLKKVSHSYHGLETLVNLQKEAQNTIGIDVSELETDAFKISINCWIDHIESLNKQLKTIIEKIKSFAKQSPYFNILCSLKGISETTAALFIAETWGLCDFEHYKKIEKYAGYNLKQNQSGNYMGIRRISHIGNRRLRWVLYCMTKEAVRYIPEVRIKFLKRQLIKRSFRKNVVACTSILLKLIVSLIKNNRLYEYKDEAVKKVELLEKEFQALKKRKKQPGSLEN